MGYIVIHPQDNVQVSLEDGHKYARQDICKGAAVIKYGFAIGTASADIPKGAHVHSHNLQTALSGVQAYTYRPNFPSLPALQPASISAFVRRNGDIGIRNDVWIVNTVGCVSALAAKIAAQTGAFAFPHPYGCSQLDGDHLRTQQTLCGLIRHPNAGGVLVLGLGCENNNLAQLQSVLGDAFDPARVRFLNAQDCADELAQGIRLVKELQAYASRDRRETVSVSRLKIGLKCGGSDGLSGLTANPLIGRVTDRLVAMGGTAVLTEVPEMFGAEQILMNRCVNETVFAQTVELINAYKTYFIRHEQPVSENPSPGNKAGGITTLEEKSLGCVQKGGTAPVCAVLDYGDTATLPGLQLLNGPGNDMVAVTNLTAAGCHLILFSTGRGTPLGAPVPTLKIATNDALATRKSNWIDANAFGMLTNAEATTDALFSQILETANGAYTKNEENAYREIAIFKDGVTL